mmetsp:Transcript_7900/g.12774  ORF Transcript_7900/g.12774 Transcript_7900/m.12774 type:complete len:298 (+) Transcript_7900:99-992(+)
MLKQKSLVEDWGKAIVHDDHADRIDDQIRMMRSGVSEKDWVFGGVDGGFKYWIPSVSDVKELRCWVEGTFDCSAQCFFETVKDAKVHMQLDGSIAKIDELEQYDMHNVAYHVVMKPMYYTAPRDVVNFDHWQTDEETGDIYKVGFSIDHDKAPRSENESKMCRAFSWGGTVIKPDLHDERKCTVTTYLSIDVRLDTVPNWIVRAFAGRAQKMNAQEMVAKMKKLNKICAKNQRRLPARHVMVNSGGVVSTDLLDDQAAATAKHAQEDEATAYSALQATDVAFALVAATAYMYAVCSV